MIYIILFSCSYLESKEDARTIVKRWLNQEITFPDSINTTSQDSLWQFMLKKEFKIMSVPAVIKNNDKLLFGSKTIDEILDFIEE